MEFNISHSGLEYCVGRFTHRLEVVPLPHDRRAILAETRAGSFERAISPNSAVTRALPGTAHSPGASGFRRPLTAARDDPI